MDIFTIANDVTMQCRRCHASISMDIFAILYVVTTQRRMFYTDIPMNTSITTKILISQLGTSCAFDSPGLARNEPTLGEHLQGDSTP
ncbi:tetrahydrofolate synthase [Segatella salivae]|uniref:tetrahydrofolate synthase n=1 Tax=Segatella salivae TaxID=228604 RepID=UPI00352EF4F8